MQIDLPIISSSLESSESAARLFTRCDLKEREELSDFNPWGIFIWKGKHVTTAFIAWLVLFQDKKDALLCRWMNFTHRFFKQNTLVFSNQFWDWFFKAESPTYELVGFFSSCLSQSFSLCGSRQLVMLIKASDTDRNVRKKFNCISPDKLWQKQIPPSGFSSALLF